MQDLIKKNKNVLLILIDIIVIILGYIVSMQFLDISIKNTKTFIIEIVMVIFVYEVYLNIFQMYRNMLRYEVGKDYIKYIISAFLSIITITACNQIFKLEYLNFKLNTLS